MGVSMDKEENVLDSCGGSGKRQKEADVNRCLLNNHLRHFNFNPTNQISEFICS